MRDWLSKSSPIYAGAKSFIHLYTSIRTVDAILSLTGNQCKVFITGVMESYIYVLNVPYNANTP